MRWIRSTLHDPLNRGGGRGAGIRFSLPTFKGEPVHDNAQPFRDQAQGAPAALSGQLEIEEIARLSSAILERIATVVVGMSETVELALATILAGGHALFEDV